MAGADMSPELIGLLTDISLAVGALGAVVVGFVNHTKINTDTRGQ